MEGLLITGGGPASFGWSLVTTFGIYKQPQVFYVTFGGLLLVTCTLRILWCSNKRTFYN